MERADAIRDDDRLSGDGSAQGKEDGTQAFVIRPLRLLVPRHGILQVHPAYELTLGIGVKSLAILIP